MQLLNSHKWKQHRNTKSTEKIGDVNTKISNTSGLVTTTVLNIKLVKLKIKYQILIISDYYFS